MSARLPAILIIAEINDLRYNKLYKLPIYLLENIEYLDISQNHISKIPDLKEYVKLTVLIVSENIINFIENRRIYKLSGFALNWCSQ